MKKQSLLGRLGVHGTLMLLLVWSTLPFLWTFQTSLKKTKDVIAKEPVLWGYEPSAGSYRKFWLRDKDADMWRVGLYILAFAALALVIALLGKHMQKKWSVRVGPTA